MEFTLIELRKQYQLNIGIKSFNIITAWDNESPAGTLSLAQVLENEASIYEVDYNGHFGSAIFFTVDSDDDNLITLSNVNYIIETWVANAEKLCEVYKIEVD